MVRKPREERRNLNIEEMEAMGFVDFSEANDDDGWPYPDDDDEETTESYLEGQEHMGRRRRRL